MTYQDETEFHALLELFKKLPQRKHVLEIGSLHGETLNRWMEEMESGGTIVSIDSLVHPNDPRYAIQKTGHEVVWLQWAYERGLTFFCLNSDSKAPDTIALVKRLLPQLDFLFIDGGHDYATCLSDWQNYGPLVRPSGMVAFHDLGREWPDVRRVWNEARKGHISMELVQSPDRFGVGVLYV